MTTCYRFGSFVLRPELRSIARDGVRVPLGSRAFDVLLALVQRRHRVVTKSELLDLVWPQSVVEENNLQVQVSALRRALGHDAFVTVSGRGYRFALPVREIADDDAHATHDVAVPHAHELHGKAARSIERRQLLLRLRPLRLRLAASARRRGA